MMSERIYLASPHMGGSERRYVDLAFDTNWIAPLGANVTGFEQDLQQYLGAGYVTALSAGTAALHLAVRLAGVQRGDRVFCQSLTFSASANPIVYEGGEPVFLDSEPDTWNLDPETIEAAIARFGVPKALIAVHLYGMPGQARRHPQPVRRARHPAHRGCGRGTRLGVPRAEMRHVRALRRAVVQRQQDHHDLRRRRARLPG